MKKLFMLPLLILGMSLVVNCNSSSEKLTLEDFCGQKPVGSWQGMLSPKDTALTYKLFFDKSVRRGVDEVMVDKAYYDFYKDGKKKVICGL